MTTEKDKIIELLLKRNLTSRQISGETGIKKEHVYVYLNELLKEKKICRLDDQKPYIYFTVNYVGFLKFLNEFFKDNIDYLIDNPDITKFLEEKSEIFNKIEKVIESA